MSKRQLGAQLHEAVLTSLTALSRSASSITNRNVDSAVDYVFEQVSDYHKTCSVCFKLIFLWNAVKQVWQIIVTILFAAKCIHTLYW